MAGHGPPPKPPHGRRRGNAPARGDWTTLRPLKKTVLPNLPARGKGNGHWSARTREAWKAWGEDPVTGQYGPSEIGQAIDLAFIYEDWVRAPTGALTSEVRLRQDALGLTMKGKRDLRFVIAEAEDDVAGDTDGRRRPSSASRLRVVDAEVA